MEWFFSEHRKHQGFPMKKNEASMEDLEEDGDAVFFFGGPPHSPPNSSKQHIQIWTNLNKVIKYMILLSLWGVQDMYSMGLAESLRLSLA